MRTWLRWQRWSYDSCRVVVVVVVVVGKSTNLLLGRLELAEEALLSELEHCICSTSGDDAAGSDLALTGGGLLEDLDDIFFRLLLMEFTRWLLADCIVLELLLVFISGKYTGYSLLHTITQNVSRNVWHFVIWVWLSFSVLLNQLTWCLFFVRWFRLTLSSLNAIFLHS